MTAEDRISAYMSFRFFLGLELIRDKERECVNVFVTDGKGKNRGVALIRGSDWVKGCFHWF